jgi:hypothetical protein
MDEQLLQQTKLPLQELSLHSGAHVDDYSHLHKWRHGKFIGLAYDAHHWSGSFFIKNVHDFFENVLRQVGQKGF